MNIALISDTHGQILPEIPEEAEVIIHAGDVCPDIYKAGRYQLQWLQEVFAPWAESQMRPIYLTWGNHDFVGERLPIGTILDVLPSNVIIGVDNWFHVGDKMAWFSPWSPIFGGWAFMEPEDRLAIRYEGIPKDASIVVSHTPPFGLGDSLDPTMQVGKGPSNVGSKALLEALEGLPHLELVVCGHIHYDRGIHYLQRPLENGETTNIPIVNASCVDEQYNPVPDPVILVEV